MDVARHFGLTHIPFRAVTAPDDAWQGGPVAAAAAALLSRLRRGDRIVALAGPTGSGKSLTLRTVASRLEAAGELVHYAGCIDQLDPELPARGVLLIDEADAASSEALHRLVDAAAKGPQLVLAGQGGYLGNLGGPPDVRPVQLALLKPAQARSFIADRTLRAGDADLFTPAAVEVETLRGRTCGTH